MQEPMKQAFPPNSAEVPEMIIDCDRHGPYKARDYMAQLTALTGIPGMKREPSWSKCPTCAEEVQAERAEKERIAASMERQHKVASLVKNTCIPPRFASRGFAEYAAKSPGQNMALTVAKKFVANWADCQKSGRSLIFTGGPGTGKTHLACAIARGVAEQHLAAPLFMTVSSALRHIKSTYRKDSERTETQALGDLVDDPDLLIIDEIGVQVGSDHEKLLLFEILNERYQYLRPTILISNLNLTELESYLGQRIMDRYRECGAVIAFDWDSHRGAQQ